MNHHHEPLSLANFHCDLLLFTTDINYYYELILTTTINHIKSIAPWLSTLGSTPVAGPGALAADVRAPGGASQHHPVQRQHLGLRQGQPMGHGHADLGRDATEPGAAAAGGLVAGGWLDHEIR